jgi:hypothetical protein
MSELRDLSEALRAATSIEDPDIRHRDCAEHLSAALVTLSGAVRILGAMNR